MDKIESVAQLEALYGTTMERALWKEIDHINPHYQRFIERSPFLILSTYGENGLDCSPRGDPPGFVRVVDEKCLQIPDRRGNNRLDSLKNIVVNSQVGLIFMVPGAGETIRVAGGAEILLDNELCESFAVQGKAPRSVISVSVHKAYFQCQKALVRSRLWDPASWTERGLLPTAGEMAEVFAQEKGQVFDAGSYDRDYPEHMKNTIY